MLSHSVSSSRSYGGEDACSVAQFCGVPRAGAGKILPRPRRTSGGETAGPTRPYARGAGQSPAGAVLQVLIALVLVVARCWRERATLPLGVHPHAVGHPPGSGLGPAGEGGAHHRLNDLRPQGPSLLGPVLADGVRMNHLPQPNTDSGSLALPGPSLSPRPRWRQERSSTAPPGSARGRCRGGWASERRRAGESCTAGRALMRCP